jgi:hypothetical protein
MDKYLKPYTTLAVGILLGAFVAPRVIRAVKG